MSVSFTSITNLILVVFTLLIYMVPDIAPQDFPLGVFLAYLIPICIVLNLIYIPIWLLKKDYLFVLVPILTISLGFKFIDRTIAFHPTPKEGIKNFTVLNCNVRIFNVYDHLKDENYNSSKKMVTWVRNFPAEIACLQEFYSSQFNPIFFTKPKIKEKFPYAYVVPFLETRKQLFGMAIFSKHPIVNRGEIKFREKSNNQIIFADIKIKKDTIRIYNIHLQSMAIDENDIVNTTFDNNSKNKWYRILMRYKNGSIQRGRQVDELTQHIEKCPYRVVVCGDLNEPPYGYAYEELSDILDNSFQESGNGFGSTYNGKIPFLRIDNQFFSTGLESLKYTRHREMNYSDHYPISVSYRIIE